MLPAAFLDEIRAVLGPERLCSDPADCLAYAYDNSRKPCMPEAVAFPSNTTEVQAVVSACNRHRVPLTPRGRGTGTAGGAVPERGGLVLSLERMTRILAIDPADRLVIAEAGVLNQSVQDAVRPFGFFWPPDPSSAAYSSIGGNLATCAAGPHAVKYGVTRDHVLGLTAVTARGEIVHTGTRTTKGVVGYDLTRLLIGSEGTLAVITEAILKLTPLPPARAGMTMHYRDLAACARAITRIMAQPHGPSALEFLDEGALALLSRHHAGLVPEASRAMLMIEVDGRPEEIEATMAAIRAAADDPALLVAERADDGRLWAARKALSPLLRDIAPKKINEDVVVPVASLPEFLTGVADIARRADIANVNFGHAGNGNIHVNLLVDPHDPDQAARAETCLTEIFDLVLRLHGTLSGEHGVGREKRPFIAREIDPPTLALMRDIKRLFDPNGILNPGKIFPP